MSKADIESMSADEYIAWDMGIQRAIFTRDWFAYGKPEAIRRQKQDQLGVLVNLHQTEFGDLYIIDPERPAA